MSEVKAKSLYKRMDDVSKKVRKTGVRIMVAGICLTILFIVIGVIVSSVTQT